jgi:hypothetical protein
MNTTELNTTDYIRTISDKDLGAVTGGFQVYTGGGSGKMAKSNPHRGFLDRVPGVYGVGVAMAEGALILAAFL